MSRGCDHPHLMHSQLFGCQLPHQARLLLLLTLHAGSSCTEQSGPLSPQGHSHLRQQPTHQRVGTCCTPAAWLTHTASSCFLVSWGKPLQTETAGMEATCKLTAWFCIVMQLAGQRIREVRSNLSLCTMQLL